MSSAVPDIKAALEAGEPVLGARLRIRLRSERHRSSASHLWMFDGEAQSLPYAVQAVGRAFPARCPCRPVPRSPWPPPLAPPAPRPVARLRSSASRLLWRGDEPKPMMHGRETSGPEMAVDNTREELRKKILIHNRPTQKLRSTSETYAMRRTGSCWCANRRNGCRWRSGIHYLSTNFVMLRTRPALMLLIQPIDRYCL